MSYTDGFCDHDCFDNGCDDYCSHEHCLNCGECGCPGYCDDYQTYNLRPAGDGIDPAEVSHAADSSGV